VKNGSPLFRLRCTCDGELTEHVKAARELADGLSFSEPPKDAGKTTENPWVKAGEGSWVVFKMVTEMAEPAKMTTEMTQKQTLVDKGVDELTLKLELKLLGANAMELPATEQKLPVKNAVADGDQKPAKELKKGEETLTVGEKKVACKWVENEFEANEEKTTTRVWTSDEVPGTLVRVETKSSKLTFTMSLVDFEMKGAKKK
jgi:hypothetical protein